MSEKTIHESHRARIREKFLTGDVASRSEVALLELLLTYATLAYKVQLNPERIVRRLGNLGSILGLAPKGTR